MIRTGTTGQPLRQPKRLRFSVDDYYKLIELGMIKDYKRSEIIDGVMISKATIGDKHAVVVTALSRLFTTSLSRSILVSIHNPLRLSDFDEP